MSAALTDDILEHDACVDFPVLILHRHSVCSTVIPKWILDMDLHVIHQLSWLVSVQDLLFPNTYHVKVCCCWC